MESIKQILKLLNLVLTTYSGLSPIHCITLSVVVVATVALLVAM